MYCEPVGSTNGTGFGGFGPIVLSATRSSARAFLDPFAVDLPDAAHPDRLILLGMTMPERLLYMVYTERTSSGRLRIISARRATRHEQKNYKDG
jgi:uncharacterized DUF497 family protein